MGTSTRTRAREFRYVATTVLSATMLATQVGSAQAALPSPGERIAAQSPASQLFGTEPVTPELIAEVEALFTKYLTLTDASFAINRDAIVADGLEDRLEDFQSLATTFNMIATGTPPAGQSPGVSIAGVEEFAECLIVGTIGVSASTMPGLIQAIITGVRAWNWGLVASTVARIVGPIALRSIGGPAGLAAALAGAAAGCAWSHLRG